jgi:hypothetical protein
VASVAIHTKSAIAGNPAATSGHEAPNSTRAKK